MPSETTCTRCGAGVPSILDGPPPRGRDIWWRYQIRMTRREVRHVLRFRMFRLCWLPEHPEDRLSETYTTLELCDSCAGDVFLFAQGKYKAVARNA